MCNDMTFKFQYEIKPILGIHQKPTITIYKLEVKDQI